MLSSPLYIFVCICIPFLTFSFVFDMRHYHKMTMICFQEDVYVCIRQ